MRAEFEIISDRIESIHHGKTARRERVRMLGLRDTDRTHPLNQPADFILGEEDAHRFAHVFRACPVGRVLTLAVRDFHVMGFGAAVRFAGRIADLR